MPLTVAGVVVLALGVAAYVGGWQLGWIELMVLAAACLGAVAAAVPFVVGRIRLEVAHTVEPARVPCNADRAPVARLTVSNPTRGRSRRQTVIEPVGAGPPHSFPVDPIGPGDERTERIKLPHDRRAKIVVGPAVIARHDPLNLMRRAVVHADPQICWIHPAHDLLPPLSAGFAKDLEGPTSDSSPAGDVAFHALRPYVPGDDYRHIHWMSTARRSDGEPIVRHYVDNRRPQTLVLIDDRAEVLAPEPFEVALQIAASLIVSADAHREPVAIWNLDGPLLGRSRPGSTDDALDQLTEADRRDAGDPIEAARTALRHERHTSVMVLITGSLDVDQLGLTVSELRRRTRLIVARVWPADAEIEPFRLRGVRIIDVHDLAEFAVGWRRLT